MTISQSMSDIGDAVRHLTFKQSKLSTHDMAQALADYTSTINALAPFPVMNDGKGHLPTINADGSQTFTGQGGFTAEEVHADGDPTVSLKKGDTLVQAFTIKANAFSKVTFNFKGSVSQAHAAPANVSKIANDTYRVWATYTSTQDEDIKLLEFWSLVPATSITLSNPYAAVIASGG